MQSTIKRTFPGLGALNAIMRPYGAELAIALITPGQDVNFSRKSATPGQLDDSYGRAMREVAASGLAVPAAFVDSEPIVSLCVGHGYIGSNPAGMGLVMAADQLDSRVALGVPFADASAAILVHAPTGLEAAISGVGHLLYRGAVPEAITLLEQQVKALGHRFSKSDLWAFLSPGARHGYRVNDRMLKVKLAFVAPDTLSGVVHQNVYTGDRPHSLDLAELFRRLWAAAGVPEEQISFDGRNTIVDVVLPSKRRSEANGEPDYGSGLLVAVRRGL